MKIGILGAGAVGTALAKAFTRTGHDVMLSSREPKSPKMQALLAEIPRSKAGTVSETVTFGDIIMISIGWQNGLEETLRQVSDWSGKILVDTTNRFNSSSPLTAAQDIAQITKAPVVKAFNIIGAEHMDAPQFGDEAARKVLSPMITAIGFDVVDLGGLEHSRELEALAQIWVGLAMRQRMGRNIAFKLLRK
jgi:8-hydroxy-5-deazaflavin:NADPH oxidoreductase